MKKKYLFTFILVLFILLTLACGKENATNTPEAEQQDTPAAQEPEPTEPEEEVTSGAVSSLDDAESAVIHIITEGTIFDPTAGEITTGSSGSGFVIDPSGIAVTNNHVVTGAARLKVYFSDHSKAYNARILGVSECSDLAVIDIEGDGFPYLEWYDGTIDIGLEVYSLGYPRGTESFTRNGGAVSKRPISMSTGWASVESIVEHDALINPGNSGGPLVDANGKVVGVNYSSNVGDSRYYAIAYNEAKGVIDQLKQEKNVTSLGINGQAFVLQSGASGIWVSSVKSGSPADNAGLKGGDIIMSIENIQLGQQGTMAEYCDILRTHGPNDTMSMSVYRTPTGEELAGQFNGRQLEPVNVVAEVPTESPVEQPTEVLAEEPPAYYTEEFDVVPEYWEYYLERGSEDEFSLWVDNGRLHFEITGEQNYLYVFYNYWIYGDVEVDVLTRNVGANNTNNVGMVCRAKEDYSAWYEVNVNSNGYIYYYYYTSSGGYELLHQGASMSINMGQNKDNYYSMVCIGDKIKLYINGTEQQVVTDDRLRDQGLVGIVVASVDVVPIAVDFESVTITPP